MLASAFNMDKVISIHALVKRATLAVIRQAVNDYHFNPRPREEGDTDNAVFRLSSSDFNPRPREEGDGNSDDT